MLTIKYCNGHSIKRNLIASKAMTVEYYKVYFRIKTLNVFLPSVLLYRHEVYFQIYVVYSTWEKIFQSIYTSLFFFK